MQKIEALIKPFKLEEVKQGLAGLDPVPEHYLHSGFRNRIDAHHFGSPATALR